ncbi:MAG: hypothetical protein QXI16_06280 [Sulfolobaceae archaeon]
MTTLYNAIIDFLELLFPQTAPNDLLTLNQVLAYFITIYLVWVVLARPLLKLFRLIDRK